MNLRIDRTTATVIDAPATTAAAPAPAPVVNADHDRRKLDDLLRQRGERLARLAAD